MQKQVKDIADGEMFTETGLYNPTCTRVYYVEKALDNGLILCRDTTGWGRCFEATDIVYPLYFSSLDGQPYRA